MPVDTSFYNSGYGAGTPPQSAFGQLSQLAQTQNALNQNALFKQQMDSRAVMGQIMQSSVDPTTGKPDFEKAAVGLSTNPITAPYAAGMINQWITNNNLQAETAQKSLANAQTRMTMLNSVVSPLALKWSQNGVPSDPTNPKQADMTELMQSVGRVIGQDPDLTKEAVQFLAQAKSMPKDALLSQLVNMTKQTQIASHGLSGVLDTFRQDTGGNITTGNTDKLTGQNTITGQLSKGLTPEAYNTPQKTVAESGKTYEVPRGGAFGSPPSGVWTPATAPVTGKPGGEAVTTQPDGGTGGSTAAVGGPAGTSAPVPVAAAPSAAGVPTSLTPYKAKALDEIATKYEPDLNQRTSAANQLQLLMSQVRDETDNFKTGGGASGYMKMGQLAQAMGLKSSAVDALSNGDLASSQAANKLFMQVGSQVAATLVHAGGGRMTQTEWSKILSEGSANIDLDPKAISKIFAAMREVTHYTGLESQAFQAAKQRYESGNYDLTNFQNDWQKNLSSHIANRSRGPQAAPQPTQPAAGVP